MHFNSDDLESGNADKGLSGGVGDGQGDWRLELVTTLEIEPLGYVRTADGFVTSMHDVLVQGESMRYHVPIFNPGSNLSQVSRLRLINPANTDAEVVIEGLDDRGALPATNVRSRCLRGGPAPSAHRSSSRARGLADRILWRRGGQVALVRLRRPPDSGDEPARKPHRSSDQPVHVHLQARSRSPEFAPERPVRIRQVVERKADVWQISSPATMEFVSPAASVRAEGVYVYKGRYTYENIGPNAGRLELYYDVGADRDRCTISLTFDSAVTGILVYSCDNGDTGTSSWQLEDVPEPDTEPDLVVELTVSDRSPDPGERFTLTATVRNQGDRRSAATTLRYYRSVNVTVSTSDTEVGRDLVESLAPSGESEESTG